MNQNLLFFTILFFLFFFHVEAQSPPPSSTNTTNAPTSNSFRPGVAIVIGILSIMFSLTFLLLIYAKFCHSSFPADLLHQDRTQLGPDGLIRPNSSRFSGIDKTVIESLPFFKFSSLKGSKEGLECVVCLSIFEDTEILRLLPKCKHAFHISCVDQWLEKHSSCPLCRHKVDPDDMNIFTYSASMRFSRNQSDLSDDPNLELFVRREFDDRGSSRFSIGSSFRMMIDKEGVIPCLKVDNEFKHEIVETDGMLKNRWSDVSPSDIIALNSEMLNATSTMRFPSESRSLVPDKLSMKIKEELERRRYFESKIDTSYSGSGSTSIPSTSELLENDNPRSVVFSGKRSISDITKLTRFADSGGRNKIKEASSDGNGGREERLRRIWFPIARRTVEWIAGRERRSKQPEHSRQVSLV